MTRPPERSTREIAEEVVYPYGIPVDAKESWLIGRIIAALDAERTRAVAMERERDHIAFCVEHPEQAHLHYDGCPYKPWADKLDSEIPDDAPECTCGEAKKGAYWKGQLLLERGYHTLTKQRAEAMRGVVADCAAMLTRQGWRSIHAPDGGSPEQDLLARCLALL